MGQLGFFDADKRLAALSAKGDPLEAIDRLVPSGLVNLTTVLAHSSGEWIASDWPVCPIAEMAMPHRMGASLTYARRYALFTLVGIAGEEDLDAPDLSACGAAAGGPSSSQSGNGRGRGAAKSNTAMVLDAAQSAALREKLLTEVASLTSAEFAVTWATQALPAKNSLIAADAKILEEAFEQKVSGLSSSSGRETSRNESVATVKMSLQEQLLASRAASNQTAGIDKSVLTVAAPRRYRNREHLRYVAQQACLICGRKPSDPHHLRHLQPRALGRKASDEFTVPLCRAHHRAVHRTSDEQKWWQSTGIDPVKVARKLWKHTRVIEGRIRPERTPERIDSHQALKTSETDGPAPA